MEEKKGFLVLSQRVQDQIELSNNIKIIILKIKGKQVQIGIQAPQSIKIKRVKVFSKDGKSKTGKTIVTKGHISSKGPLDDGNVLDNNRGPSFE